MEQGDATVDPAEDDTQPLVTRHPDLDTGDLINPYAPDPRPEPVDDPADPSWVEAADDAVTVDPDRLLPADPPYESELSASRAVPYMVDVALPEPVEAAPPVGHSADCTAAGGWCGEPAHCPPPYVGAQTGDPYPPAVGIASPVGLPPVGTSLPGAPDLTASDSLGDHLLRDQQLPADRADLFPDPERDPEGHA